MNFCDDCGNRLVSKTNTGELKFYCEKCSKYYDSSPEDTIRSDVSYELSEQENKYKVLKQNAPFDPAGNKVSIPCKKCGMPYKTKIYIGSEYKLTYVCVCDNN
jgi:DNA-directed RNA polymerase subunit M/transcription elongation factor TFIIS